MSIGSDILKETLKLTGQDIVNSITGAMHYFASGTYGGLSHLSELFDKSSRWMAEKGSALTGIPEEELHGGLFEQSADFFKKLSQAQLETGKKKGVPEVPAEIWKGLGQAGVDIGAISALGPYGLPVYGGLTGLVEGGPKGALTGAITGGLTRKILGGINLLPSTTRLPAFAGLGAAITPGGVEERAAGAGVWAGLGMTGKGQPLTREQFLQNYPKIKAKITEIKARKAVKALVPEVTAREIKEAGGATRALEEAIVIMRKAMPHAGEAVSPEALARGKVQEFHLYDARTKRLKPLIGVEAVDIAPKSHEAKVAINKQTSAIDYIDYGERLTTAARPLIEQEVYKVKGLVEKLPPSEISRREPGREYKEKEINIEKLEEMPTEATLEAEGHKKLYAGLPLPKGTTRVVNRLVDALQIEPQFARIGAPDTGLAAKQYHSIRDANMKKAEQFKKDLEKKYKLTSKEWQQVSWIAARPHEKLKQLSKEDRVKFTQPVRQIRQYFANYARELKKTGILFEEWPKNQIRDIEYEIADIKDKLRHYSHFRISQKAKVKARKQQLHKKLRTAQMTKSFLKTAKYVHIPSTWAENVWATKPQDMNKIITQFFHKRKMADIEDWAKYLLKKEIIKPYQADIRYIMGAYAHKAGHKLAIAKIFKTAIQEGVLKKTTRKLPEDWQYLPAREFPTLKNYKAHPVLVDCLEKNLSRRKFAMPQLGRVLTTIKMLQFYNPVFLPMYDVVQAWWSGSVRSKYTPRSIGRAFNSMKAKDQSYWDASFDGAFSKPFSAPFERAAKQMREWTEGQSFFKRARKYINPYRLSWEFAWKGDNFIRMITYHHYLQKGFTSKESAQLTAKLHADYASIPPKTRGWMNKVFFTPSFKIAMMTAQIDMVKNAGKYLTQASKMPKSEKAMAKALVGLVSGIALRHAILVKLGFKQDKLGLKYTKNIITEEGEEKELVLHTSSPDNVFLRYYHRFTNLPIGEDRIKAIADRAKWELHPAWQALYEIIANKSLDFKSVYNPFDQPEEITKDILGYTTTRWLRILELVPKLQSEKRRKALQSLKNDVGPVWGNILKWVSLPYVRSPKYRRLMFEAIEIERRFKEFLRDVPPDESEKKFNKRLDKALEEIRKRLEKINQ